MSIFNQTEKIDILLLQPPKIIDKTFNIRGTEIPLSLAYLAAFLEREKVNAEILDMAVYKDSWKLLEEFVRKLKPDFVGITAFTVDIVMANEVAKRVKEFNKNITTIIGGIHASALPKETMEEFPNFDYLIYGEGERTLLELIVNLQNSKGVEDIKGIGYRINGSVTITPPRPVVESLDDLPFPARHKLDLVKYVPMEPNYLQLPSTGILGSRGCPYSCTFCSKGVWGRKTRMRSATNIINEIEYCMDTYNIKDFRFYDDSVTWSYKRLEEFCNTIVEKKLDISWNCFSRVDLVNDNILRLMKMAGCYNIKYGVEAGTEKSLNTIKKGATLEQAREAIKLTRKYGIESKASFMIGIPGEDVEDVKQTINFAKELSPDFASFAIIKPLPGSKMFNEARKNNEILHTRWQEYLISGSVVMAVGIPSHKLDELLLYATRSFYFRIEYLIQRMRMILRNPKFLKRDIKGLLTAIRILVFRK